jgi:uncharacterized protein (TIGR03663 family)
MDLKAKIKAHWPEVLILLAAAAARLVLLSMKPPHFDEGVNGWFVDQMTHTGFYHYDPTNYHGPFHFYVLFLAQTLFGRHIWALRLPLALISLATVALTIRFDRFIGRNAALWAAAAMALSPGSVFYARYAIHEDWLVFALMLLAWGLMGIWQSGEKKYLWAAWIGVTLAVLTKETYVIHFAALALTVPCVAILGLLGKDEDYSGLPPQQWAAVDMGLGAIMCMGAVLFFYSGCGMDFHGLEGLYTTFGAWFHTGQTGNGHEKAWFYWIKLFGRYEWPSCIGVLAALPLVLPKSPRWVWTLLGAIIVLWLGWCGVIKLAAAQGHWLWHTWGEQDLKTAEYAQWLTWPYLLLCGAVFLATVCATPRAPRFVRALAVYGIGTLVAYSIIHYKTPWCIVSLTWPFMLLFGYGVECAARKFHANAEVLAGVAVFGSLCFMTFLNFFHYTDANEPYVYVQTFPAVNDVMNPIYKLVGRYPGNYQMSGHILLDSYHPLPWLLGDFPNIGYYDDNTTPPKMDADFLMVDESRSEEVESQLHETYYTEVLTLRDAQAPSKVYFNARTFAGIFPGRTPEFVPDPNATPTPTPTP